MELVSDQPYFTPSDRRTSAITTGLFGAALLIVIATVFLIVDIISLVGNCETHTSTQ